MADLEWGHPGLTPPGPGRGHARAQAQAAHRLDAVVALPGGCGTLEELFEGDHAQAPGPVFQPDPVLDTDAFYQPLQAFLQQVIEKKFLNPEHAQMWSLVGEPEGVLPAIAATPKWREDARNYAIVR
jgi:predicted Rossmann-fold nucleotide-binding protein